MSAKRPTPAIDLLNIGLMLASAAAALSWPFPTFLFAYAVLGPAHYLTEISWLHDRGYFTKRRTDVLVLVAAGAATIALPFVVPLLPWRIPPSVGAVITFLAFAAAAVFATTAGTRTRAAL